LNRSSDLEEFREGEYPAEKISSRSFPGQCHPKGGIPGKLLSPSKRRKMVDTVLKTPKVSERRACRVLGQTRTTQRHSPHTKDDEERLVARIIELATRYGRYGYRRITALLKLGRLEGKPQESRENLEKRGSEGTTEAAKEGKALLSMMAHVSGSSLNIRTMCGAMIL